MLMNGLPYLDPDNAPDRLPNRRARVRIAPLAPPSRCILGARHGRRSGESGRLFVIVMPVAVSHTDQPGGMRHCMPIRLCAKRPANPVAPSGAGVTIAHLGEVIWVRRDGAPWTAGLTRLFPPGSADGGGPPNPRFVATTPPGPDRPGIARLRRLDGAGPGARIGERRPRTFCACAAPTGITW